MKKLLNVCMVFMLLMGMNGIDMVSANEGEVLGNTILDESVETNEQVKDSKLDNHSQTDDIVPSAIENEIINDLTGIPDPKLYAAVLKAGDFNGDGKLTRDEAEAITDLECVASEVSNLNGIEYLSNLKSLDLDSNDITNISALSKLEKLTYLNLPSNNITDISALSKLENLTFLDLNRNNITNISALSGLINLQSLFLSSNDITDISSVSGLINLQKLSLDGNNIINISTLNKLVNLKGLYLSSCNITDISALENLSNLQDLFLFDNNITDISVLENFKQLESLWISGNNIADISGLSGLTNLESLYLDDNNLTDILAIAKLKNLQYLSLAKNHIANISVLSELTKLKYLNLCNNSLTNLPDLTKLINLDITLSMDFVDLSGNKLTEAELKAKMPKHLAENKEWVDRNKYTKGQIDENKPGISSPSKHIEYISANVIPSDLKTVFYDNSVESIVVTLTQSDTVTSDIFKAVQETNKNITFNVLGENNRIKYSWSFSNLYGGNPNMDLNLNIQFETDKRKEIEEITHQSNLFYISFAHHGALPGQAIVKVDVSDTYKDGDYIYLYYYNEENGTIERKGKGSQVIDGYAQFTIDHCSVYFLTTSPLEEIDSIHNINAQLPADSVNTGVETNVIAYALISIIMLGFMGIMIYTENKKAKQ